MAEPPGRTVRDVIETAYRKLGKYDAAETISSDGMVAGLSAFQDMIAAGDIAPPAYYKEAVTLVAGQISYTIGEDGSPDLDTVRPDSIVSAFIRSGDQDYPVTVIGERAYRKISNKSGSAGTPKYLWYNPTVPNGTIYIHGAPVSADALWVTSFRSFIDGATLTQATMKDIQVPRFDALNAIYNLAIELAPECGLDPPATVVANAERYNRISDRKTAASRVQPLEIDFATSGNTNNDMIGL